MKIALFIISLLLIAGCAAAISEEQASAIARNFAQKQVRPFARSESDLTANVTNMHVAVVLAQRERSGWLITLNLTGIVDGTVKSAPVIVGVNNKGNVFSLNGQLLTTAR